MILEKLEEHLHTLALLEPESAPIISCYLDCTGGPAGCQKLVEERACVLRNVLPAIALQDFDKALGRIQGFLETDVGVMTRGMALFAREGNTPFFLALKFEVPLPDWITTGSTPDLFHLVELADNYDRYAILLMSESSARIIGINLGSVTDLIVKTRLESRDHASQERKGRQYDNRQRERTARFVREQIGVLAGVMAAGRYAHLILAGTARATALVRKGLSKDLAARLVDSVPASASDRISDILTSTLECFLLHEETESQAIADRLVTQIYINGLAVAGAGPTLEAFRSNQADFLVIAKNYEPTSGWECRACGRVGLDLAYPNFCPDCRNTCVRQFEVRSELVRLAKQRRCGVEVVEHNDALLAVGGVGCLLRFRSPAHYASKAA